MRNQLLILFILFCGTFFISCDNSVFEPEIGTPQDVNNIGVFVIENTVPASRELYLSWTKAVNAVSYDILINDTLSISGISVNYCSISGLKPDTDYKISIRAINKDLSVKTISENIRTLKELINGIYQIKFGKYDFSNYIFSQCIKTQNNGYIFFGECEEYNNGYKLFVKTDENYNILWHKEFPTGDSFHSFTTMEQNIKECTNGDLLEMADY